MKFNKNKVHESTPRASLLYDKKKLLQKMYALSADRNSEVLNSNNGNKSAVAHKLARCDASCP